jgi:hypothetical protein
MKAMRSYRLDEEVIEMLEAIAKSQRRSLGNVLEILVEKEYNAKKEEYEKHHEQ